MEACCCRCCLCCCCCRYWVDSSSHCSCLGLLAGLHDSCDSLLPNSTILHQWLCYCYPREYPFERRTVPQRKLHRQSPIINNNKGRQHNNNSSSSLASERPPARPSCRLFTYIKKDPKGSCLFPLGSPLKKSLSRENPKHTLSALLSSCTHTHTHTHSFLHKNEKRIIVGTYIYIYIYIMLVIRSTSNKKNFA